MTMTLKLPPRFRVGFLPLAGEDEERSGPRLTRPPARPQSAHRVFFLPSACSTPNTPTLAEKIGGGGGVGSSLEIRAVGVTSVYFQSKVVGFFSQQSRSRLLGRSLSKCCLFMNTNVRSVDPIQQEFYPCQFVSLVQIDMIYTTSQKCGHAFSCNFFLHCI